MDVVGDEVVVWVVLDDCWCLFYYCVCRVVECVGVYLICRVWYLRGCVFDCEFCVRNLFMDYICGFVIFLVLFLGVLVDGWVLMSWCCVVIIVFW